ncbi:tRNA preQ1(34) S-adenosylmethionine ribosyltransferase-isomerase QueA [Wenzhouxiangella sp. AB-CW3]|uniref:tRNA preQ1(34) S-adenosylmethionine ribosyltransferase-isomerase QueA n=1 Tax=Wenzhouxiangella sp. AB-CW3 TaxID=2771012 RepID=UPI00168C0DE5|nr:tRNA preQ1(34) S-adenosylmethionine ribosyltransferase-isomerase QueA [Wenzhouxiangella sp. AB-CW3]QOC21366.1 tRNA preQ1(34) S-adenosylmethionine ribosyltransferase-isomerase QueA [Wenzhouxiangella sp. AB-CW3]
MKVSDFHFDLPEHLIAQYPLSQRSASRLLHLERNTGRCHDRQFTDLPELLSAGDLLVFNNTRVVPARLHARKSSGGRVEVMLERMLSSRRALVQLRANRRVADGTRLQVADLAELVVVEQQDTFWVVEVLSGPDWTQLLEQAGHMPLPPYISRADEALDESRYQTVYARVPGAVAAPTAGLHFDDAMMERLRAQGVEMAWCTLHVGAGTFQPVRVEHVEDHRMHAEWLEVDDALVSQVRAARARGSRVVAVGTTAVRSLETAVASGDIETFSGDSRLFIHPGYRFRVVDAMVTNFHLPGSTLLMLVSAFAGRENVLAAYRHAIDREYRFFSYGDAMFLG